MGDHKPSFEEIKIMRKMMRAFPGSPRFLALKEEWESIRSKSEIPTTIAYCAMHRKTFDAKENCPHCRFNEEIPEGEHFIGTEGKPTM